MKKYTVGVIGLGNMGKGIAKNFSKKNYHLAVWDVSSAACKSFRKSNSVQFLEPVEMAKFCRTIFLVVPGSAEIEKILKGKKGILNNARQGLVLYDLTTSDPVHTKRLAKKAAKKKVSYLDAGMSGGASGAEAGNLTLMIGGKEEAYIETRKHLKVFAANLFYLGDSGAGHTLKLIHNMVCHTIFLATCEGGRMAELAGIRLEDMIDVFNLANARSYISETRFPKHILSKKWDAKSKVSNLHKDLKMAVSLSKSLGTNPDLGEQTLLFLENAVAQGMENDDFSLLFRDFQKIKDAS
ncbi:MAG: NAD(P)-dependent oxidoreductase [SAR324 cluster bacterium]|nr:NAD(P)-dependent oxidoreductase [SAR324 cluster bacterium]